MKTVEEFAAEIAANPGAAGKTPDKKDFATPEEYTAACQAQRSEDLRRRHANSQPNETDVK